MSSSNSRPSQHRLLLLLIHIALMPAAGTSAAYVINAQQGNYQSEPRFIRDRFEFIDSLPFDGMTISTATGRNLMNGTPRSYAQMALDFAPLNGLVFKRVKHNFALVNVLRPADFFDDWSVTIENFRLLARVLRYKRIEGIFFDNEEYGAGVFNYPQDCSDPSRSLSEYQDQARLRGRQIMEAMSREHPTLVFIALHGPYSSFAGTPDQVRGGQTDWRLEQLRGPFSAGLIEGLGTRATFVDGGEVYAYRSESDFQVSYDFRKVTIASAEANCPFISAPLRPLWPSKVSIAFGVYNHPFGGAPMDPAILRTTLEHALHRADRYVWLYSENLNWNAPGEVTQDWIDAVAGARAAAADPPSDPAPWVTLTSPGNRSIFTRAYPLTLSANASSANRRVTKVEFLKGVTKIGESLTPPFSHTWAHPSAGTYWIKARVTDESGATSVSSPIKLTVTSAFAARINFQPEGVTPPVGYHIDDGETYAARTGVLSYGWNVDHRLNARHRAAGNFDLHLATLVQLQAGGKWEIAVPDGSYSVTVGIGDSDYTSIHTLHVEGVSLWAAEIQAAGRFVRRTRTVKVSDGKLTLDHGSGAFEATRINYIHVTGLRPAVP